MPDSQQLPDDHDDETDSRTDFSEQPRQSEDDDIASGYLGTDPGGP